MKISEPRFLRTYRISCNTIRTHNIKKLPIEPFFIVIQHPNWRTMTYEQFALRHKITIGEVIEIADSIDGCAFYQADKNRYLILYNDDPSYIHEPRRITWTLMHEIGHIVLGHLEEVGESVISRSTLTESKYEQLEKEAHFFAACTLAPFVVLHQLDISNYQSIMSFCGLSKEAAIKREAALKNWRKRRRISQDDFCVLTQFHDFIHQKKCNYCGFGIVSEKAKYCPVCSNTLVWGEGRMIIYYGYQLDQNCKAVICPICQNKEMYQNAEYCHICGTYLVNKCADIVNHDLNGNFYVEKQNCGSLAPGNARFCMYCGNPTTFYLNKLLNGWQEAKAQIEAAAAAATATKPKLKAVSDTDDLPF